MRKAAHVTRPHYKPALRYSHLQAPDRAPGRRGCVLEVTDGLGHIPHVPLLLFRSAPTALPRVVPVNKQRDFCHLKAVMTSPVSGACKSAMSMTNLLHGSKERCPDDKLARILGELTQMVNEKVQVPRSSSELLVKQRLLDR